MNLLNDARWIRNNSVGRLNWLPTVNRVIDLPDDDGQVSIVNSTSQPFSAAVRFNKILTSHVTHTVPGSITFTIASGTKLPGSRCLYTLIANGTNIPDFSAFTESSESFGYDGRTGVINYIQFYFDGVRHTYKIWQDKVIPQAYTNIALSFPNKSGTAITQNGQIYTGTSTITTEFNSYMSSAQAIPANKAGRLTARVSLLALVGLGDTNTAESYLSDNLDYYVWQNSDNFIYTGSLNRFNYVKSNIATAPLMYVRLTRSSLGVVTIESSTDNNTWNLVRTYTNTFLGALYVTVNLAGAKTFEVISFEVAP